MTGQTGKDIRDNYMGQDVRDRTMGTGPPGQVHLNKLAWQVTLGRIARRR